MTTVPTSENSRGERCTVTSAVQRRPFLDLGGAARFSCHKTRHDRAFPSRARPNPTFAGLRVCPQTCAEINVGDGVPTAQEVCPQTFKLGYGERMKPQPTGVVAPIQLRIADDLRMKIESGDLAPGDPLPTLQDICDDWDCSMNSARAAIALLKQQGLISGGRGKAPTVRRPVPRVCRTSDRHQAEKDLVREPESVRAVTGLAEMDMGTSIDHVTFNTVYDVITPSPELAQDFEIPQDAEVLQRIYEMRDRKDNRLLSWSVSYLPMSIISGNKALSDPANEPWPGGTMHQLSTVGVEIARVTDLVSASMPTTATAHEWRLDDGVPMIHVRRISYDTDDRVVEISDADFPADRTELSFTTPLKKW